MVAQKLCTSYDDPDSIVAMVACHLIIFRPIVLLATFLLKPTYRKDVPLFIDGQNIFSSEGISQGNALAMKMYSVSVTPLIASLQDPRATQLWFADDANAGGTLHGLHDWWLDFKIYAHFTVIIQML